MKFFNAARVICFFAVSSLLSAQIQELGSPNITNVETEQFEASGQNFAAVQDGRGVMYFGNNSGVLEFDGQRWQLIEVPGSAVVRTLVAGPDGTIYYGTVGDFGYLAASSTGKARAVSLKASIPPADRNFNDIWQAVSSRYGIYFLAQAKVFRLDHGKVSTTDGKFSKSQACLLNGIVIYVDADKGICLLKGDRAIPIPGLNGVTNGKRLVLAPFGRHQLLVGRVSGDFLQVDLQNLWNETAQAYDVGRVLSKECIKPFPCELGGFINEKNGYLYKMIQLDEERFALGTLNAGIAIFNRSGKALQILNKQRGLLDNTVGGLFLDRVGDLWSCNHSGVSHIELSVPQSYFGPRDGLENTAICVISHGGRLLVGTVGDLSIRQPFRVDSPAALRFKSIPTGVAQGWQFLDLGKDLLMATSGGLFKVQGDRAVLIQETSLYCLATSTRWPDHVFAGALVGVEVYRRSTGRWQRLGIIEGIIDAVRSIAEDAQGNLWLGTEARGLLRLHFTAANPTRVEIQRFGPEQGLPGLANMLPVIQGSTLYVLTDKGLFRADLSGPAAGLRFEVDTNLGKPFCNPPVALRGLVFDREGNAFLNTAYGIFWAVPGKDGQYRMEPRPFQGIVPQTEPSYLHPDGSLWLPGKRLYRFDPKAFKNYDQPFDTLVRKVITKGKRLIFEGTYTHPGQPSHFQSRQGIEDLPELPFRENSLTFEYAATFFEKPGTTKFQFIMDGIDKDWSEWTTDSRKDFHYLPEGRYRFRVRAQNVYGTLGQEAVFGFRVLPPWYRALWAYALWIITGGGVLAGVTYFYTLKLRRQSDVLEQSVAQRTQQLRDASLTDPLTGLRNRRFITEVLQEDISAFLGYKTHLLSKPVNSRSRIGEDSVYGMFLIDIDHFKQINDTYGHGAGDLVLQQFAEILKASVRQDDAIIRLGGEEFLVILKQIVPDYLHRYAAKLLEKVATTYFDLGDGQRVQKTCSIGYTCLPIYQSGPGLLTFDQCTMVADLGMYYAKGHGRNQAIYLEQGERIPEGKDVVQKLVASLDLAMEGGYLKLGP